MEVIRSLSQLRAHHQECVATIGNFDGVHLGHQAVFEQLIDKSRDLNLPSVVISFEPQPQEFFMPDQAPARLTRLREKVLALRQFPLDRLLCLRFNQHLANWSPETFISQVLVEGLSVKYLIVGDDFRFGARRKGDFHTLENAGKQYGFQVVNTPTRSLENERISSTRVRKALQNGDMNEAARLLGRPYSLCGRVAHGAKLGRQLGFPTANISLNRHAIPVKGVFAVRMLGIDNRSYFGVANVGNRPTVAGGEPKPLLETHLFDFNQDIYGKYVEIELLHHLRSEQKFASLDALKYQITQDIEKAKLFFTTFLNEFKL
ncbi:MAG: bifunctional riboflavin kinase/FAD synthetase [Pseudomonadota bacterium]|jgi:riboflavin kinase/FMN adenylyltransferase